MTTKNGLFDNSELALAAYAKFPSIDSEKNTLNYRTELKESGMTDIQITEFATRYPKIISSIPDTSSGFSATVFKSADGKLSVAIRGTTDIVDLSDADFAEIVAHGAAYKQIVDMYNWWQILASPAGTPVQQYSVEYSTSPPDGSVATLYIKDYDQHHMPTYAYLVLQDTTVAATGECYGQSVDVTGHSLGGHLAGAFTALFADNITINSTTTFNAPGFTNECTALFAGLGGVMPFAISNSVTRVRGDEALPGGSMGELISGLHQAVGSDIHIAIENQYGLPAGDDADPVLNHSQVILTDSLAAFNLLAKLDASLSVDTYQRIFHSASNINNASLESIVDAVESLLGINTAALTPGAANRNNFYQAIYAIQDSASFKSLMGVTVLSAADLNAEKAATDFSAFMSLHTLSPVYLAGANLNNPANQSTYSDWLAGKFSNDYIADRSHSLQLILTRNAADKNLLKPQSGETIYYDYSKNKEIFGNGGNEAINTADDVNNPQVHFGSAAADTIRGGKGNDHFYGGAGRDTYIFDLAAGFGNDVIDDADGGVLSGLSFNVTHIGSWNNGNKDGIYVFLNDKGEQDPTKVGWSVLVNGTNATLTARDANGKLHSIRFEKFDADNNNFGLVLNDGSQWPQPSQTGAFEVGSGKLGTSTGEPAKDIYLAPTRAATFSALYNTNSDPASLAYQTRSANEKIFANVDYPTLNRAIYYEAGTYHHDGEDRLFEGSSVNDVLNGKNWTGTQTTPHLWGSTNYAGDMLLGLHGDDVITGDGSTTDQSNGDNDILIGGRGNDRIYGGGGDDWLFAAEQSYQTYGMPMPSVGLNYKTDLYDSANEALYNNAKIYNPLSKTETAFDLVLEDINESNYLDGGDGDDTLVGASFNDTLLGGMGNDDIYAGAGRDIVSGGSGEDIIFGDSYQFYFSDYFEVDFIAPDILPQVGDYTRAYFYKRNSGTGNAIPRYDQKNSAFNDVIDGGEGNDIVFGEIGNDIINGGRGEDTLFGDRPYNPDLFADLDVGQFQKLSRTYHGDDVIDGGDGNDMLVGGGGNDLLMGGDEAVSGNYSDIIYGDMGIYTIDREVGTGQVRINASDTQWWGNDTIWGGKGNDMLLGEGGDDVINGGDDNDYLYGDWHAAAQKITANDYMNYGGKDTLDGGAGSDTIYGGAGNDTLIGGTGNDSLYGEAGNDSYVIHGGDGRDVIQDTQGFNTLKLSATWLRDGYVQCMQYFGKNNKYVVRLYTSQNLDNYVDIDADSWKTITGFLRDGNNNVLNVQNNTRVIEGTYKDTNFLDGISYLVDTDGVSKAGGLAAANNISELAFDDSHRVSVSFAGVGANLVLTKLNGKTVNLSISNWENYLGVFDYAFRHAGYQIDVSSNGVDATFSGKKGNDLIIGGRANETLNGNEGEDRLYGAAGADTLFGGDGNDWLDTGDSTGDLAMGGSGYDTYVVKDFRSTVIEKNDYGIDEVRSYGTYTLGDHIENLTMIGSSGYGYGNTANNILTGSAYDDTLYGLAGDDTLLGNAGDDLLSGGNGNDILYGDAGADTLTGGKGSDSLFGGSGSDTYRFVLGHNQDSINNFAANASIQDEDVLVIDASAAVDYRNLWLHQDNNDLVINLLGSTDQVTVKNWFAVQDNNCDENELDAIRINNGNSSWVLTNNQALVDGVNDRFDLLLQAMATWEAAHPGTTPTTAALSQNEYDSSWVLAAT